MRFGTDPALPLEHDEFQKQDILLHSPSATCQIGTQVFKEGIELLRRVLKARICSLYLWHYVKGPDTNHLIKDIFLLCRRTSGSGKYQSLKLKDTSDSPYQKLLSIPAIPVPNSYWEDSWSHSLDRKRADPAPRTDAASPDTILSHHFSPTSWHHKTGKKKLAQGPSGWTSRSSKASALTSEWLWCR